MASSSTSTSLPTPDPRWLLLLLLLAPACGEQAEEITVPRDNEPPAAVLQAPASASPGESVPLDASPSFDEDGRIDRYLFDFGDGGPWFESISPTVFHTWTDPGTYQVTLVVIDDLGTKDSTSIDVEIR